MAKQTNKYSLDFTAGGKSWRITEIDGDYAYIRETIEGKTTGEILKRNYLEIVKYLNK